MAAWLPILKAVLPYVTEIVADRLPVFTKRKTTDQAELTVQQIAELQQASEHNAAAVKALAEQLKNTVQALEGAAGSHERVIGDLREQVAALHRAQEQALARCAAVETKLKLQKRITQVALAAAALSLLAGLLLHFK